MNKVYHGSPTKDIKELVPKKSTHMEEYVYATVSPVIALIFSVENLGDLDHDIMLKDGKVIFTERREGAFEKYNTSGYLYELDGTNFKHISNIWDAEVVSTEKEKVQKCYYIENVLEKLKEYQESGEIVIYRYPNKPDFIPKDDSDLVNKYIGFEKQGHKGSIDELVYYFPYLKEKVFAQLEDPEALYVVSQDDDFMSSNLYAYDNVFDAVLNANVFVRDNGWLNYRIVDSKMVFERGGFNYDNTFYLYEITGKYDRMSSSEFAVQKPVIISKQVIDLSIFDSNAMAKRPK